MKIGSMLKSNLTVMAVLFLVLNSTGCYLNADSGKNNPEEISINEAVKILEFADTELETSENFLTGLLDIGLIIKIEEVSQSLKNSNKVSSEIRGHKFASKIANLLKKAYRKTRCTDSPGFAFKEEVATLLSLAYEKWSEEDPLRDNLKNWMKQISEELEKENTAQKIKESNDSQVSSKDDQYCENEVKSTRIQNDSENHDRDTQAIVREKQIRKQKPRINSVQTTEIQQETAAKPRQKKQRKNSFQAQPTQTERQSVEDNSNFEKNRKQPLAWEQKPAKTVINSKSVSSAPGNRKRNKNAQQTTDATHQLERRKPKNTQKGQTDRKKREVKGSSDLSRKSEIGSHEKTGTTTFRST